MFDNGAAIRVVDHLCDANLASECEDIECRLRFYGCFLNRDSGCEIPN
jgi:hypothetical protein